MSTTTVSVNTDALVNWSASGGDRISQNVQNLLNTMQYEIAFDRTLGMPTSMVDTPATELINSLEARVVDLIERNEPRAKVVSVEVSSEQDGGQIQFEVVIESAG